LEQPGGGVAPGPAALRSAAQVFVEDLSTPVPSESDVHHLARVLRLRPGETVVASDGRGGWRICRFTGSSPWLEPEGEVGRIDRPQSLVTVGFVPVKGERPEWVVQKLTEIGVDRILVLRSSRSVVVWDGPRGVGALDRLRKVAAQAACQSRRVWLPEVDGVAELSGLARTEPVVLAERGGGTPEVGPAMCIGPEGGWSDDELALAQGTVGLGDAVLRSETAAVVGGTLVCALRDQRITPFGHS
jgi:16S rRNA (uracil1498-N3)-methyltransferase